MKSGAFRIDLSSEVAEYLSKGGHMKETLFSRKTLLCILIRYESLNKMPNFSYGYVSTVGTDYWGVCLNMFEDIIYPLGINVHDAIRVLEEEGPEAIMQLEPSSNFTPLKHERKLLLRVIQSLMHEATGSDRCRSIMSKNLGCEVSKVGCDFRSKAKSITLHLVEEYCRAAGVRISDVFKRYFELYGDLPQGNVPKEPYPEALKE